jgi:hypothetical protein
MTFLKAVLAYLTSLLSWRPALPGVVVSGFDYVGRAANAVWSSFWACWNNPMTYPLIITIAVVMFSVGHKEGSHMLAAVRADLKDTKAQLAEVQGRVAAAQINEQAARRAAKEAINKLALFEAKQVQPAEPAKLVSTQPKKKAEPKKPDTSWKLF